MSPFSIKKKLAVNTQVFKIETYISRCACLKKLSISRKIGNIAGLQWSKSNEENPHVYTTLKNMSAIKSQKIH